MKTIKNLLLLVLVLTVALFVFTGCENNNGTPDTITTAPNTTTTQPDGTTETPDGTTTQPDGTTETPDGTTEPPDGTTTQPDGTTETPDGTTTQPDGTTEIPGDTTETPEDTTVPEDTTHTHVFKDATCTEPKTCECGATEGEALGHDYKTEITAPTCTEDGYTTYTCACGDTYKGDTVPAKHSYDANGVCSACGDKTAVTPEVGKGYIFGMYQGKLDKVYYLKGGMNGYYMDTTTNPAEAIYVYIEETEGGYYFYTYVNGAKTYINMVVSGTHVNGAYQTSASTIYTIDEESKTLIAKVDGTDYWFATRNDNTYTTMGPCKVSFAGFYGEFYFAHEHSYEKGETVDPTCEEDGYTNYSCSCGVSYKGDVITAPGHTYENGKCHCGADDPDYEAPSESKTHSVDFGTIVLPQSKPNGDSSYTATYTTASGWVSSNSAIQCGGTTVMNPQFPVIGADNTFKAVCLNGKTSAPGKLTSPTLNGGISKLTLIFTKMFTDTKLSVTVTVTELATGNKYTHVISMELPKDEKYEKYTDEWVLETPVSGEFTIEIVNNCPSAATGNKDRLTILDLTWTENAGHTHNHKLTSSTATCTAAGINTYTCECGDTYTEEVAAGHVDANLDVSCDREGCTAKVAPAADSILSLFTANNLGAKLSTDRMYYVVGTIVEVKDAKSGIFFISDETGEKFYFRLPKDANGTAHADWAIKLMAGDKIKLYGKINKFSTSEAPGGHYPAMQGPTLVEIITQHPHDFTFDPADCFYPAHCACGQANGEPTGHTDSDSNGICDACLLNAAAKLEEIKTHYNDIKDTANVTSDKMFWKGTEFDVTVNKGSGTLNSNATTHVRVQNNNNLVISAKNGKKIVSLTFVSTTASYVDELQLFLESAGYTCTVNGLEVTVTVNELTSVTLENTSKKVARFTTVMVAYIDGTESAE